MARPEKYPEWASSGVNVVEPTEAKKDEGWLDGERPPAKWFNWLLKLINDWIVNFVDEIDNDIGAQIDSLQSDLADEVSNRTSADTTLQGNIDVVSTNLGYENSARIAADDDLEDAIDTVTANLATEAGTRAGADTVLDGRLDDYDADTTMETGSSMELEGFSTTQTQPWYAQFIRKRDGTNTVVEVHLWLAALTATSDSGQLYYTDATIPASLRPDTDQSIPIMVYENSSRQLGFINLSTTGNWTIYLADGSMFTTTGTKGVTAQLLIYRKSIV